MLIGKQPWNLLAKGKSVTPKDRFPEPYLNPIKP